MSLSRPYKHRGLKVLLALAAVAAAALVLVRPQIASADLPIAQDDLEDGDSTWTGLGWLDQWQFNNGFFWPFNNPHSGFWHLWIRESGYVTRQFDITGEQNIHLQFWARADDLDTGTAYAEVSADGSNFHALQSWSHNNGDDNVYRPYDFDISSLGLQFDGQVWLRFRVSGTGNDGDLFVDDIQALSVGEDADTPPPPSEDSPIDIDGQFGDWSGKAKITDPLGDQDGSSRKDIVTFYWANNVDGEVDYHMIERRTTDGQPFDGHNGQDGESDYILYIDANDDGDYHDDSDRRVQVSYSPKHGFGKVRVKVYDGNSSHKISDSGWHDWGESREEGGLRFEFPVSWEDLGIDFGGVLRMYLVSYDQSFNHPDVEDRAPDGSADIQWSPASVLGPFVLAGAAALGFVVIWYFKGRRQWT